MAEVGKDDYLIDLGSGDGRIVIEAAKRGARGLGRGHRPEPGAPARPRTRRRPAWRRARASRRATSSTPTCRGASVVAFYLLPEFNAKLLPRLLALKPGTRIVSHDGGIGDWPPDERLEMRAPEKPVGVGGVSRVELWIVPADARGSWVSEVPQHGGRWSFDDQASASRSSTSTVGGARARPVRAQQPPARHRDQDGGHRHRRQPRLEPPVRGPHRGRPHRRRSSPFRTATQTRTYPWTATRAVKPKAAALGARRHLPHRRHGDRRRASSRLPALVAGNTASADAVPARLDARRRGLAVRRAGVRGARRAPSGDRRRVRLPAARARRAAPRSCSPGRA